MDLQSISHVQDKEEKELIEFNNAIKVLYFKQMKKKKKIQTLKKQLEGGGQLEVKMVENKLYAIEIEIQQLKEKSY